MSFVVTLGLLVVLLSASAGSLASAGRRGDQPLVVPRGARFGEATRRTGAHDTSATAVVRLHRRQPATIGRPLAAGKDAA